MHEKAVFGGKCRCHDGLPELCGFVRLVVGTVEEVLVDEFAQCRLHNTVRDFFLEDSTEKRAFDVFFNRVAARG